jgi:ribonuclease HII
MSIAAASVLAKTHRDEYMLRLHEDFPDYYWQKNKGYPTRQHRKAIAESGITDHHRKSFTLLPNDRQSSLIF